MLLLKTKKSRTQKIMKRKRKQNDNPIDSTILNNDTASVVVVIILEVKYNT